MKQKLHDREKQRVRVCGAGAVSVYVCYYCLLHTFDAGDRRSAAKRWPSLCN